MILIIDFGGQTAHLISRRLKDLGVSSILVEPDKALQLIKKQKPQGLIFSGGPSSVYEKGALTIDPAIFTLPIPMLDICYGLQLRVILMGGEVVSGTKEYGPATINIRNQRSKIKNKLPKKFTVWMSHGDSVLAVPKGFSIIGSTETVPFAFIADEKNKYYGVQFHPEIEHTEYGIQILSNFINICKIKQTQNTVDTNQLVENIKQTVGNSFVIGAISGGVDSTVAGTLTAKAISKKFIPIFVDNGLMRDDARQTVKQIFKGFNIQPIIVAAKEEMLKRLQNVTDSEKKRKIIGAFYIEMFEREVAKLSKQGTNVDFLLQGTIFSDVIESKGSKHASKIKSHHNVGGLPQNMKLKLLEPLRNLYKDEVRALGRAIGVPEEFVNKQVFPGPGFAVRIRGEVTAKRLEQIKIADKIVQEELQIAGLLHNVYMAFPVLTGAHSTAVKGDGRFFGEVIALRAIESNDVMSSTWAKLPYGVLQKLSSRIVNEVPEISRVVYDITTKPPATMEWE